MELGGPQPVKVLSPEILLLMERAEVIFNTAGNILRRAAASGVGAQEALPYSPRQLVAAVLADPGLGGQRRRTMGTPAVLNGSNDDAPLSRLYLALCGESGLAHPLNRSQERFVRAWELTGFLASDGFEWVFEQEYGVDELAAMLADVGFQEGAAFIRRAYSMVPEALLPPGQEHLLVEHLRSNFEPFKALLHEYFRVTDNLLLPALGNFVRQNRRDFEAVLA